MTVNEVIGSLSPREREIAEAYVAGASHKEIARQFDISPATVRTHLRAIYRKLEVASKLELAGALRDEPAPPAGPGRDAQLLVADLALELDEAMRRERILARVLRIISQEGDRLDAVIDAVLDHALEICEAEFGVLFEYCGDLRFRAMQWRNISPSFGRWLSDQDVFEVDAETGLGRVARGLESVNIADVRSEDIYRERAPLRMATGDPDGARSFAAIPMMSGGHLIGAFTVYRTRVHPFNERSLELARLFADQAAIAIKNARRPDKAAAAETEAQADPPLLAILPFRATDETDDDLGRTGRRLAAGIVMELSSTPHFRLIDLASSFSERLAASPPAQAMKTLGAGLIVTGQIRRAAAGRVRIAAWLHQAGHFPPLWTERFDLPGADRETLLETLLVRLCAAIGTTVERALVIRSRRSPGPNALDHFLDGLAFHHRHTADAYREARARFILALDLDPEFSRAAAARAITYVREWFWQSRRSDLLDTAERHARTAIGLAPHDAWAQTVWGVVALYRGRHAEAEQSVARALELAPHDALVKLYGGDQESAIDLLRRSIALDPLHADRQSGMLGHALFLAGRYDEAIACLETIDTPLVWELAWLAASLISSGNESRAAVAAEALRVSLRGDGGYELDSRPYRCAAHRDKLRESLLTLGIQL